jgi:hypothetical protein
MARQAFLCVLVFGMLLSGCSSTALYKDTKKPIPETSGRILFYRTDFESGVYNPEPKLDGTCLGTLKYLHISSVDLLPGKHVITSKHAADIPLVIGVGETKYIRIDSDIDFFKVTQALKLVSTADAEKETEDLIYSAWNPSDCADQKK